MTKPIPGTRMRLQRGLVLHYTPKESLPPQTKIASPRVRLEEQLKRVEEALIRAREEVAIRSAAPVSLVERHDAADARCEPWRKRNTQTKSCCDHLLGLAKAKRDEAGALRSESEHLEKLARFASGLAMRLERSANRLETFRATREFTAKQTELRELTHAREALERAEKKARGRVRQGELQLARLERRRGRLLAELAAAQQNGEKT